MSQQEEIYQNGNILTFIAPSGYSYTLREQNGEDDDVLSHPGDARTLMNLSKFISRIVIDNNFEGNTSGRLTPDQAHSLPILDRYAILIHSRIHSLGKTLDFKYHWPKEEGGIKEYEVDLEEYLLDYSKNTAELDKELLDKPDAIPYYPGKGAPMSGNEFDLKSGKQIKLDLLSGVSEGLLLGIPENDKTKNTELLIRNLHLKMEDGTWVKVNRFHLFSPKDMAEIRAIVKFIDPPFFAKTEIENPSTGQKVFLNIMGLPDFFYLGEM